MIEEPWQRAIRLRDAAIAAFVAGPQRQLRCVHCGEPFVSSWRHQRFCDTPCRSAYHAARAAAKHA